MKVVGFNTLGKKKKKPKAKIFCISHLFRNLMIIFSITIFLFVFNIINTSFTSTFKECINNFITTFSKLNIF